ncbi:hypothetical protein [Methanoregula sp.]|uniref:hypothetical protein n=1 Tax=Methanoregula sp. TaxID=2052170 RepID=UPI003BAFFFCB
MPSGRGTRAKGTKGTKKSGITYTSSHEDTGSGTPAGVHESTLDTAGNRKIETLLTDIVTRLDRIEEKIDENVYPPESAIKPEFIRQVKKAEADIRKGKGKTYESMGAFVKAISE